MNLVFARRQFAKVVLPFIIRPEMANDFFPRQQLQFYPGQHGPDGILQNSFEHLPVP